MSTLSEGDVFGAAALFNRNPDYPTTLTALTPCRVLLLPQEAVRRLLRESPAFAEDYVTYLSQRIQFLSARLDAVSASTAEGKLSQFLRNADDGSGELSISATRLSTSLGWAGPPCTGPLRRWNRRAPSPARARPSAFWTGKNSGPDQI